MLHTTVRVKRDKYTISARISLTTINNDTKLILVMHRTGVKYPLTNVVDAVQRASSPSPSHCIHLIRRVRDRRICGPCVMLFALLIALALCHRRFALAVVLMCRRVFVLAESFATRVGLPRLVYKKSGSMSLWRQELVPLLSLTAFCHQHKPDSNNQFNVFISSLKLCPSYTFLGRSSPSPPLCIPRSSLSSVVSSHPRPFLMARKLSLAVCLTSESVLSSLMIVSVASQRSG